MIGLLIVTHAPLASALLTCATHVYGSTPEQCATLDIPSQSDPAQLLGQARHHIETLDQGDGVLVLTDLFGATPSNIAAQLGRSGKVAVLTGVNVPMLLRALTYRANTNLEGLVEKALAGGTAGVMKLASTAQQNQRLTGSDIQDATARLHHQQ